MRQVCVRLRPAAVGVGEPLLAVVVPFKVGHGPAAYYGVS